MKKFLLLLTTISFQLLCMESQEQLGLKDLPEEIIPLVALQFDCLATIYNFKLVCSAHNQLCNIDIVLEDKSCAVAIASHFDDCNKALVHYAQTKNEKLFQKIWDLQSDADKQQRDKAVQLLCRVTTVDLEHIMRAYSGICENKTEEFLRQQNKRDKTLLKQILQGNRDAVKILLRNGADPNIATKQTDKNIKYGLHYVAQCGDAAMAELLVAYGASIYIPCISLSNTPLHYAAESGNVRIIKLL